MNDVVKVRNFEPMNFLFRGGIVLDLDGRLVLGHPPACCAYAHAVPRTYLLALNAEYTYIYVAAVSVSRRTELLHRMHPLSSRHDEQEVRVNAVALNK